MPAAALALATASPGQDVGTAETALPASAASQSVPLPVARASASDALAEPEPHPLSGLTPRDLELMLHQRPAQLGAASVGEPTRGALYNGVQLVSSDYLEVVSPANAWGTTATMMAIDHAAREVRRRFGAGPKLHLGDVSARNGGHLRPHRSHQSGVDADIGYFYSDGSLWYAQATADNLDRARTWLAVKTLIDHGDVEYMFIDGSIQLLLREHAERSGEDPLLLDDLFASDARPGAPIRHTWGHRNHFHVRFADPIARETGRRLHDLLRRTGRLWTR
jgi:penicillin-insensitive murein endopeptidase